MSPEQQPHHAEDRRRTVQSIARALDVLEALAAGDAGVSQIGRRVGLSASTTHRILATLVDREYVERLDGGNRYSIGHRSLALAGAAGRHQRLIREAARPLLHRLRRVAGATANLSVLDGGQVVFIDQELDPESGSTAIDDPVRLPPHVSASGKALLAFAPAGRARAALAAGTPRFTPHTIVDPSALEHDLAAVRARGFAIDDGERRSGFVCIAAPIFDGTGAAVAALSVGAWRERLAANAPEDLAELVATACTEISATLGARGVDERRR